MKLLIAEDDPDMQKILNHFLTVSAKRCPAD